MPQAIQAMAIVHAIIFKNYGKNKRELANI